MIDLAAAYDRLAEILDTHGLSTRPYCLEVQVWNHRRPDHSVAVEFSASVHLGAGDVVRAHGLPTLDAALTELDHKILDILHERARTLAPRPEAPDLAHVTLPEPAAK